MKNYIILLFAVFTVSQAFSQKKYKEGSKEYKIDSLSKSTIMYSALADSLTKLNNSLTVQLDSISKNYNVLYTTIREKVLKHDFDPARTSQIIDSLAAGRDSTSSWLTTSTTAMMDSLNLLKKQNHELRLTLDGFSEEENYKNRLTYELKKLKELLDSKILTPEEFTSMKKKVLQNWQ